MDFNFDLLKTFRLVAAHENYTRVAEIMGVNQGTVSRQMGRLEDIVGTQLLISYPKGVRLTDAGRYVCEQMDERLFNFEEIFTRARDLKSSTSGPLQIVTAKFGINWLATHLEEFKAQNPDIEITVNTDEYQMLPNASYFSGTYVGLTSLAPPRDTSLIWQEFYEFHFYPYAHPAYLQKYGIPRSFEDLDQHRIIGYRWSRAHSGLDHVASNPLLFQGRSVKNPRKAFLEVDDVLTARAMVDNGVGIGLLPLYQIVNTQAVPILQGLYQKDSYHKRSGYYVYPPYLKGNARVQKLVSYLKDIMVNKVKKMDKMWDFDSGDK
jgi:DNA-binding transcriptional LysR family regulator